MATVVYGIIGAILSFYLLFRRMPQVHRAEPGAYELRRWFGFAAPNFLTSIVDTTMESIDTLLLAFFAISNVGLGLYATAIKISSFVAMPLASFNAMFAPTIAELHSQGEHQKLAAMFQIVTKWSITFSLPIFWIVTLFAVPLLSISGPQFISAWPLVVAFATGSLINVATGPVGYILLMTGHTKTSFLNSLTAIIVNVAVGVILTPRYGVMGVAIATGMAVAVVNLMKLLQVRILVKMQPYRWDVLKPVAAGLISALLTAGLLYLTYQAHLSWQISHYHITLGLLLIPVFCACYIELLVLFRMSPEDTIVLNMLRKKIKRGKSKTH
jgi:O-antigen/teichoic acid export membrane protein